MACREPSMSAESTRLARRSGAAAKPSPNAYLLVLMWDTHHIGGVNVVVKNLAESLRRETDLDPLIAISDWNAVRRTGSDAAPRLRFAVIGKPTAIGLMKGLLTLPMRMLGIERLLHRHRVAVVNFHYFSLDALGVALLKILGIYRGKLVISIHGSDVRPAAGRVERMGQALILFAADAVVAVSQALAARAAAAFGIARERLTVVYSGVDQEVFRPDAPGVPGLVEPIGSRYIVSIGRYVSAKGQQCLLDAFSRLADEFPDLHLVMVGDDGPALAQLRHESARLGLGARVHLLGFLPPPQVAALLVRCSLCVQPSLSEGLGLTLLEASAAGAPLVVSDIPGHDEVVEHGVGGLRFPAGDATLCAQAITAQLRDGARAQSMARIQRERVRHTFTWAGCVRGYLTAIAMGGHCRRGTAPAGETH